MILVIVIVIINTKNNNAKIIIFDTLKQHIKHTQQETPAISNIAPHPTAECCRLANSINDPRAIIRLGPILKIMTDAITVFPFSMLHGYEHCNKVANTAD